ncbi:shikimate dehydrogenase [uncultured Cutibacterium sp.]|uniref:shikimate dehydrogenase family protein n=1 Tax=uncultured Cutibacterium sp. TaxID=1912223 RepID=UPI00280591BC|nr:shikimate dehydrogenase [uncultured Cutibacterium sp.]MDU1581284.1 shikimate dehydrogenase [Cutibacterium granulosum]
MIGHPIAHSLSPAMHRAAYRGLGLDWSFDAVDVASDGLADFMAGLDESWRGLAVTMPHKQELAGLGEPDELVRLLGVANTWVRTTSGPVVRNTDAPGVCDVLRQAGVHRVSSVTVLGAGATARSVLAGATRLGVRSATIVSRSRVRSQQTLALASALGVTAHWQPLDEPLASADLLVSTLPRQAFDEGEHRPPDFAGGEHRSPGTDEGEHRSPGTTLRASRAVTCAPVVFDVVYDPWPPVLLDLVRQENKVCIDGLDLLAAQGRRQVEIMTGQHVAMTTMRQAARTELARRLTKRSEERC